MIPFRALACLACLGVLGAFAACSGDDFGGSESGGSAGDDGGGSGGSAGSAGSGGVPDASAGSGGATGGTGGATGGSAGTGGGAGAPPCQDGQCAADEYCHSDGACRKCIDFDEFEFDAPEPLTAVNAAHSTETLLTPRTVSTPVELFYVAGSYPNRKIWWTNDATQSAGLALPDPVDAVADGGDLGESAPFVTEAATDGPLKGLVLFFDRTNVSSVLSGRRMMGAGYDDTNNVFLTPAYLPAPFNGATENDSSWEFTLAPQAQRAWFMSNRDNVFAPKLYTAPTGSSGTPVATPVSLTTAPYNCPVEQNLGESELSPWAARDGSFLLFQARETATGCKYGTKSDLFIVALQANGQSAGFSARCSPAYSTHRTSAARDSSRTGSRRRPASRRSRSSSGSRPKRWD